MHPATEYVNANLPESCVTNRARESILSFMRSPVHVRLTSMKSKIAILYETPNCTQLPTAGLMCMPGTIRVCGLVPSFPQLMIMPGGCPCRLCQSPQGSMVAATSSDSGRSSTRSCPQQLLLVKRLCHPAVQVHLRPSVYAGFKPVIGKTGADLVRPMLDRRVWIQLSLEPI